jgi:hypothetical protein
MMRSLRLALGFGLALSAPALDSVVKEAEARRLVQEAIVAMGKGIPSGNLKPLTFYWSPEFYHYQAYLPQSDDKPLLTFSFAVNPWNAEVWDTKNCSRLTSPAIEQEQTAIWKRSGLPEAAREPLHYHIPAECIGVAK